MDRFLDEQENPAPMVRDRSSSPSINSLMYGDPKRHNHNNEFKVAIAPEDVAVAPDVVMVKSDAVSDAVVSPSKVTTSGVGGSESAVQSTTTPRLKRLHPQHDGVVPPAGSFHPISSSEQKVADSVVPETATSTTKASIAKPCPVAGNAGDVSSSEEPCAKRAKLIANDICESVSTTSSDASQTTHYCDSSVSVSSPTRPVVNGPTVATPVTGSSFTKLQETVSAAATPMLSVNGEDHVDSVALSISTGSAVKLINDARISPMPSKSPSPMSTTAQAIPVVESLVK